MAVVLGGLGWLVWQRLVAQPRRLLETLGGELLPQVAQHIRNFRRVKVKDGRTVWEITARDAQYFQADEEVVVEGPQLTLWLDDGQRIVRVASTRGRLRLVDRELATATLEGGVVLVLDDLEMRTERAIYERAADRIVVPEAVTVSGRELDLRARRLEVEVTPQVLRFSGDVHTVWRGADGPRAS